MGSNGQGAPIRGSGFNTDPETGDWDQLSYENHSLNERVRGENTDTDDAFAIYVQGVSQTTKVFNILKTGAAYIGSTNTAVLSATAGITLAAVAAAGSGNAALRYDATIRAFQVVNPNPVGSVATYGSSSLASRDDHVHLGVASIDASGNSPLYGAVELVAGAGVGLTQTGQGITITASFGVAAGVTGGVPSLFFGTQNVAGASGRYLDAAASVLLYDGTMPAQVAAAATGIATTAARRDHGHSGVTNISASGAALLTGTVNLVAGSNITLTQSGQGITIAGTGGASAGLPALSWSTTNVAGGTNFIGSTSTVQLFDTTAPASVGTANTIGIVNFAARRDHVHLNSIGLVAMGSVASTATNSTNFNPILYTTEEYDPLGIHSVGSAGIWKPNVAGFYECSVTVGFLASVTADSLMIMSFLVNSATRYDVFRGETRSAGVSNQPYWNGTMVIPTVFNGSTDYVEATFYNTAGTDAIKSNFSIKRMV